ncbi:hypothetical protein [Nocardia sp. NPDC049149]|uniref:hypothetical protein n=1 Tax=Nocardia sp. NPDC049149 TaxID=3364315 RepID=UPI00371874BF
MGNLRKTVPVALVLAAAGLVMNAPQSVAATGISASVVYAGGGISNGIGTGCNYLAIANTNNGDHVAFYDNGVWFAGANRVPDKSFSATWIPATPGQHTILTTNGSESATVTLDVRPGINLGSSCAVI